MADEVGEDRTVAIAAGFVYMAAILDAWSRRVVGYAISRSIDARLAVAALKAAIRARQPPKGVSPAMKSWAICRLNSMLWVRCLAMAFIL